MVCDMCNPRGVQWEMEKDKDKEKYRLFFGMAVEEFGRILDYVAALHYIEEVDYPFIYELVVKAARSKNVILKPPYDCEKTTSETDETPLTDSMLRRVSLPILLPEKLIPKYVESGKQSSIQSTGNETGKDADIFNLAQILRIPKKEVEPKAIVPQKSVFCKSFRQRGDLVGYFPKDSMMCTSNEKVSRQEDPAAKMSPPSWQQVHRKKEFPLERIEKDELCSCFTELQQAVDDNRKELDYAFKFIRRSSVHQKRLEDAMKNLKKLIRR
uniref:Uncharacterized protein n=1 Tax=Ditylenchus dipsaci TaxID=166011 RepID=A0A915D434_9BILA